MWSSLVLCRAGAARRLLTRGAPVASVAQGKPPNCPQLLAAAETKMTAAAKALKAANDNMNSTLPHLDAIVAAARQNQTTHDQAYNAALTTYNDAVSQHQKAQDQYNLDQGSLVNIQKECAQPIKPPNCAQLEAKCATPPPPLPPSPSPSPTIFPALHGCSGFQTRSSHCHA
jgi:hypothetical protein